MTGQASLLSDGPSSGPCVPLDTELTLPKSPSTPTWKGRVYSGGGKPLLPVPFSLAASGSSHPTAALVSPSSHSFVHYFFFFFRVIRSVRYTLGTIRQVLLIKNKMCSPQLTLSSQSKRRNRHVHKDFPGGPMAKTLRSQCKTTWLPSLVRGPRYHTLQLKTLHATAKTQHSQINK